jgi:hypothetical protein
VKNEKRSLSVPSQARDKLEYKVLKRGVLFPFRCQGRYTSPAGVPRNGYDQHKTQNTKHKTQTQTQNKHSCLLWAAYFLVEMNGIICQDRIGTSILAAQQLPPGFINAGLGRQRRQFAGVGAGGGGNGGADDKWRLLISTSLQPGQQQPQQTGLFGGVAAAPARGRQQQQGDQSEEQEEGVVVSLLRREPDLQEEDDGSGGGSGAKGRAGGRGKGGRPTAKGDSAKAKRKGKAAGGGGKSTEAAQDFAAADWEAAEANAVAQVGPMGGGDQGALSFDDY